MTAGAGAALSHVVIRDAGWLAFSASDRLEFFDAGQPGLTPRGKPKAAIRSTIGCMAT